MLAPSLGQTLTVLSADWLFNALLAAPKGCFVVQLRSASCWWSATRRPCRDKRADTWRLHHGLSRLAGKTAGLAAHQHPASSAKASLSLSAALAALSSWAIAPTVVPSNCSISALPALAYSLSSLQCGSHLAACYMRCCSCVDSGAIGWMCLCPGCASHVAWPLRTPVRSVVEQEGCVSVRLVALVLPEDQAEALRRQKQRQARDKGRIALARCPLSRMACVLSMEDLEQVFRLERTARILKSDQMT